MFIKRLADCPEFTAGDNCRLREILHPDKQDLTLRYSLAHAVVAPGQTTWLHALKTSEVYYILSGRGEMRIDDETAPVGPATPSTSLPERRSRSPIGAPTISSFSASSIPPGGGRMKRSGEGREESA